VTSRPAVLLAYLAARRRRFADRTALEAWQARRLVATLDHARRAFPHYRDVSRSSLDAFPVMDKATMLARFADLNDRGLDLRTCLDLARAAEARRDFTASVGGVSIGLSSGTSGRQGVFLTSPAERARWAGEMLAKALPDGLRRPSRVALVLRAGGPLYESVGSSRVRFRFFDLARPTVDHLPGLATFDPTILAGPPHVLRVLADACASGDLPIGPARVFSIAEVLEPHEQLAIEGGFGTRVDQIYQATEGFLGISCRVGRLHLNEDLLVIEREPVSGTERFVPVVTDLFRTTQAVIRMRLNDLLLASDEPCPCGSPMQVVKEVQGRTDDLLELPLRDSPGHLRPFFPDFVRGAVLSAPDVEDFDVVQTASGELQLAVTPPDAFGGAARALGAAIAADGLVPPAIIRADPQPRGPLEKRRRVRRALPYPDGSPAPVEQPVPPR
jgi:putative adenylate-forming enzyme